MRKQKTIFGKMLKIAGSLALTCGLLVVFGVSTASAATMTVEVLDDDVDAGGGVTCGNITEGDLAGGDGDTTFREAYCVAINNSEQDTIDFSTGAGTITLTSAFPGYWRNEGLTIDGNGVGIVMDADDSYACFTSWDTPQDVTIKGLTLSGGCGIGLGGGGHTIGGPDSTDRNIFLKGSDTSVGAVVSLSGTGHTIENNYFGVEADGVTTDKTGGIYIGPGTIDTQTIKDNIFATVSPGQKALSTAGDITGTILFTGNYIGVGADGLTALGDVGGISIGGTSSPTLDVIIGGDEASERNVIGDVGPWGTSGINMGTVGDVTISGNYLGTNAAGTGSIGNANAAIDIYSDCSSGQTCIIGGPTEGERNIISGNDALGIQFSNNANNWQVQNNYFGLQPDGLTVLANATAIQFNSGATITDIVIGEDTATPSTYNIISGSTSRGIMFGNVTSGVTGIIVNGNYIGTNAAGTGAIANDTGVRIENGAPTVTFGNASATTPTNVISGNTNNGLHLHQDAGATVNVYSSMIGLAADGTTKLANGAAGIYVDDPFTNIGANSLTTGFNVISGNTGTGVYLSGASATGTISGNIIGLDLTGTANKGNGFAGIWASGTTTGLVIGDSSVTSLTNIIAGNGTDGVFADSNPTRIQMYSTGIGINKTATAQIGNSVNGISLLSAVNIIIGSTQTAGFNVIGEYMYIPGCSGDIKGNFIGTNSAGTAELGDTVGIGINGTAGLTIGSITSGEGNVIAFNSTGIYAQSGSSANSWRGNQFRANSTDVTLEAPPAADISGTSLTTNTTSKVAGTTSLGDSTIVDIYSRNETGSSTVYEGSTTVSSGAFELNMDFAAVAGQYYTVILTNSDSSSTPLLAPVEVVADSTAPADLTVTSSTDDTATAAYTFTGTKDAYSSVEADGSGWIAATDSATTFSYPVTLTEGDNTVNLCSVDLSGNRSGTGTVTVTLDTVAPSAPALSYSSTVSTSTTNIGVSGEGGTSVYIDGIDSGTDVDVSGSASVSVSVSAGASNTYSITLVDSAGNTSSAVVATIQGGDPPSYGGGAGGGSSAASSSSSSTTTESTTEETTTGTTTTGETTEEGTTEESTTESTDQMVGEEEVGEEDYELVIPEETEEESTENIYYVQPVSTITEETTTEEETEEESTTTTTSSVTEQLTNGTVIITYHEAAEGGEDEEPITIELTIDKNIEAETIESTIEEETIEIVEELAEKNEITVDAKDILEEILEDDDSDGVPDVIEEQLFGGTDTDGTADTDGDGITDAEEYAYGSDPFSSDSDNDGISDYVEVFALQTDPNSWDTDGDGKSDTQEVASGSSATTSDLGSYGGGAGGSNAIDSDGDGMSDEVEEAYGTDPNDSDSDNDGINDMDEIAYDFDPNAPDYLDEIDTKITNVKEGVVYNDSEILLKGTAEPGTTALIYVLDSDGNAVDVIEGEVDDAGKFAVKLKGGLGDGEYTVFVASVEGRKDVNDISGLMSILVDGTKALGSITLNSFNGEEVSDEIVTSNNQPSIEGIAQPGTVIHSTWQSLTFSSVLVADSETGEFVASSPEELEEGEHTVYLYAVDEETGVNSQTWEVNFAITGEGLLHESAAMQEAEEGKFPYSILVVLSAFALGIAYVLFRRAKSGRVEEDKMIEQL